MHTYSLVHDDLPAMDDAPLRRGAPTAHVVFGEATAILAGDALLTLGLAVLARYPERERFVPLRLAVVSLVADAIGSEGMIGGQIADLEAAGADSPSTSESGFASEERLVEIHDAKTGRLIRAALTAGALYAGATEDSLSRLDDYGRALGLAFQIKDDLLDVEADTATLGKRAGADSAARKLTFPAVRGVEGSRALLAQKVRDAIDAARSLPGGGGRLAELASYVAERSA